MNAQLAAAASAALAAINRGEGQADDHVTLGWLHLHQGDDAAAAVQFHHTLALVPQHPDALVGLANILRRQGRLRDAVLHCDAALARAPQSIDAWLERGHVLSSGGSMAAAEHSYRQVIQFAPLHPDAHAGLAAILARAGQKGMAKIHAEQALAGDPHNPIALGALAATLLEDGEAEAARSLLQPQVESLAAPSSERALLANQLGDACARLGDAAAAHEAYRQSNADFAQLHASRFNSPHPARDFITALAREIEGLAPTPQPHPGFDGPFKNHLFLLGFPRSGTTLVENILASLPGVAAVEELPTLGQADADFLAQPERLPLLQNLSAQEIERYRADYWHRISQAIGQTDHHTLVDMDPLKGSRLPLIARLFPEARLIVMRRDPRDVVWSCFHTHFALTNAAMDFSTLESAARYYAATMDFIERCSTRLELTAHSVRYETLVSDFSAETQRLCAFAGLPWSEDLRRFDRTARRRGVTTASAGQVRKALYDGSGQWRPFAAYLEPVLPILAPWIERFGYCA